ncbi:hypothetical protein [Stenotrophomonas maltophilia]|uniref:hypothetical protein n=1 Tax=Stenotrophomonas maltophilia TaxID=40324 RepID=UPI00240D806C|nr:hypothetical protein [Stenotrophomonas maltophilia]MDG2509373.1 hypothetical protein [Stenotrophomonas maltophilia]
MPATVAEWFVSIIAAGGGASLLTYHILKKLSESWLDEKFKSRLQDMAHMQNKEIERLRNELTTSFDRATKLHQREFEVLPVVWDELHEAFWATRALLSPLQMLPDVSSMRREQLEAFLEKCELEPWQKDEIRGATDRTEKYRHFEFRHRLYHVNRTRQSALNKISRHAIFLDQDMKTEIFIVLDRLNGALIEHQTNHDHVPLRAADRVDQDIDWVRKSGEGKMDEVESMIRAKLWNLQTDISSNS